MFANSRFNFIFSIILLLTISLGCNLLNSTSPDETKETVTKDEVKGTGEESDDSIDEDDDPDLKLEDEEKTDTKNAVSNSPNKTTVKFSKGATSRSYDHAVIRGEQHTYTLEASKGQSMSVSIRSLEDNASFYILSPSKTYVGDGLDDRGVTFHNGVLEESGKYKINVSPTRGNATYKITFEVSAKEKAEPPRKSGGSVRTVKFRKGKTSAGYSGAVIRGENDKYILGAKGGQLMSVSVTSLENNAVFQISSPTGANLASEKRSWSGQLPADGKYTITVSGTRGNATYKVNFAIR